MCIYIYTYVCVNIYIYVYIRALEGLRITALGSMHINTATWELARITVPKMGESLRPKMLPPICGNSNLGEVPHGAPLGITSGLQPPWKKVQACSCRTKLGSPLGL